MKTIKYCLYIVIFIAFFCFPAFGLNLEWDFENSLSTLGWQNASPDTQITMSGGLVARSAKNFIILASPQLMCFAEDNDMLALQLVASNPGQGVIYFTTSYDQQFDRNKTILFQISPGEKTYYINARAANPLWAGRIIQIIVNPGQSSAVKINWVRLVKGDLFSYAASGMQEFSGPQGRTDVASTINNIPASSFIGKPVNLYAYYIIIIFSFSAFMFFLYRRKKIDKSWPETGKATLALALILWGLLEINSLFNFMSWAKNDFGMFFGKSFGEKHAQINLPSPAVYNIYQRLIALSPVNSTYNFISDDSYAFSKNAYYLFPRLQSEKEPDFLVLYNTKQTLNLSKYLLIESIEGGNIYRRLP